MCNCFDFSEKRYSSKKAKEKFADSLLELSSKCFWGVLGAAGGAIFSPNLTVFLFVFFLFLIGGIYLRDKALRIYDKLYEPQT